MKIREIVLGRWQHWVLLMFVAAALYIMGDISLHMRRFAVFTVVLPGIVGTVMALIVWQYRPHHVVTRDPFDDTSLPHQAKEVDEV